MIKPSAFLVHSLVCSNVCILMCITNVVTFKLLLQNLQIFKVHNQKTGWPVGNQFLIEPAQIRTGIKSITTVVERVDASESGVPISNSGVNSILKFNHHNSMS